MAYKRFEEFKYEVNRQLRSRTGCSASQLGVAEKEIRKAFNDERSPNDFVTGWIKRHNLTDRKR